MDDFLIGNQPLRQLTRQTKVVYEEYRDDRYVAAVDLRNREANLFYIARAVTPGIYSVPAPFVEDMYRPEQRGIGFTSGQLTVTARQ